MKRQKFSKIITLILLPIAILLAAFGTNDKEKKIPVTYTLEEWKSISATLQNAANTVDSSNIEPAKRIPTRNSLYILNQSLTEQILKNIDSTKKPIEK